MASGERNAVAESARAFARARTRAKWRLQIRDLEYGESLTLSLSRLPWRGRYVDAERREHSARSLARLVQALLTHAP